MFDINNFPTKESAKRMLSRITRIYDKSYVGKWIFEVMGAEIDLMWDRIEELKLQASPGSATWGIQYWEQRYGIPPDPSLTLEERRKRIIERRHQADQIGKNAVCHMRQGRDHKGEHCTIYLWNIYREQRRK